MEGEEKTKILSEQEFLRGSTKMDKSYLTSVAIFTHKIEHSRKWIFFSDVHNLRGNMNVSAQDTETMAVSREGFSFDHFRNWPKTTSCTSTTYVVRRERDF